MKECFWRSSESMGLAFLSKCLVFACTKISSGGEEFDYLRLYTGEGGNINSPFVPNGFLVNMIRGAE